METAKKLKKIGLAALLGVSFMIPQKTAALSGNIRYITSEISNGDKISKGSYPELQLFYQLPLGVKGFSFMDFYQKAGYLAKTALEREIEYGIGPRVQLIHANQPLTQESVGIFAKAKFLPDGVSAKAYFMPVWRDNESNHVKNKMLLGGSIGLKLPLELNLSAWGEANTQTGKWSYGEIELGRKFDLKDFGKIEIGYNPALQPNKNYWPKLENRFSVKWHF